MNKQLLILTVALAISVSARAADPAPGIYTGTCTDLLSPAGSGIYTAEVSQVLGQNRARLICQKPGVNAYEDWVWDGTTLTVTRHIFIPGSQRPDGRMHEELDVLTASKAGDRYQVVPSDPSSDYCGMGLRPGSYLTIALTPDGFSCEAWDPRGLGQQASATPLRALAFKRIR